MSHLEKIWIETDKGGKKAIRLDWNNHRHQRIELESDCPASVTRALKKASRLIDMEIADGEI